MIALVDGASNHKSDPSEMGHFYDWKVEKLTFRYHVRPNHAKICCAVFVRSVRSPWTPPDLPNFNLNYEKNSFCEKLDLSVLPVFVVIFWPYRPVFAI
jgi:hypothetical protein